MQPGSLLNQVLARAGAPDPATVAFAASLDVIASVEPAVARSILDELRDQRTHLKLIASENFASPAALLAMGNWLSDKYAEGSPGHRFYAGCDNVDAIESRAAELARTLFGADHAYVQPHSGIDANLVAFWAVLTHRVEKPALERLGASDLPSLSAQDWEKLRVELGSQKMMGMDLFAGGHLTHGMRANVSGKLFEYSAYNVDPQTHRIDYDVVRECARRERPLLLLAGYSSYPRLINFRIFREIADEVGATLMVDMAHFAGLVAGGVFAGDFNPVPFAHVATTTTHKTLRGPRGGMVLCQSEFAEAVDRGCPLVLGGPLPHVIAAKAVALSEASQPSFRDYAARVVENARILAEALVAEGVEVFTGGTDNHLVLVDVRPFSLTGRQAEGAVRDAGITLNRNVVPYDTNGAWYQSGLRIGTPAATTLGMGPDEMREIASMLASVLRATTAETIATGPNAGKRSQARYRLNDKVAEATRARARELLQSFPLYPGIDL